MDLVKIGFQIKADGLVKANKEIDALLAKADKLNNLGGAGGGIGSGSGGKQRNQNNPAKEIDKTTKALEKQKIIGDYVSQGLDKSTATTLANFKQLGASTKDLNKMFAQLGNIKSLEQANKAVKDLAKAQKQAQKDIEKQEKAIESTRQKRLSAEQKEYQKTQEQARKAAAKQQELANKAQQNADNLRQKTLAAEQKYYQKVQEEARKAAAKQQELSDKNVAKAEAARQKSLALAQKEYQKNMELVQKQQQAQRAAQQKADEAQEKARQKKFSAEQKYYQQQQELAAKAARTQQDSINRQNHQRQNAVKQEETKAKYLGQGFSQTASTRLARMELSGADVATMERYKQALRDTAKAMNDMRDPAAAATEGNNKLLASIRGIAAYALLSTAIYGVITGVASLAKATVRMADEYTAIQNRMKLYITDAGTLAEVNKNLTQYSMENNVGLRETATLYARLAPSMQKIGANTAAITSVVDAFGKSMRIGGATAQEAASATIQFSQAMASGKLAGDEFRSISEASPRFLRAIAEGSGIAADKLKEMSAAGMLTTEVIARALLREYPKLIEENKKLGATLEQGANAIKTGFLSFIGEFNEGAKLTETVATAMLNMAQGMFTAAQSAREMGESVKKWFTDNAETINALILAFQTLAVAVASKYAIAVGIAIVQSARLLWGMTGLAASIAGMSRAALLGQVALVGLGNAAQFAWRAVGGWVGLAASVVAGVWAFNKLSTQAKDASKSLQENGESVESVIEKYKKMTSLQQEVQMQKEKNNLANLNQEYDKLKTKLVSAVTASTIYSDSTKEQAQALYKLITDYKEGHITLEQFSKVIQNSTVLTAEQKEKFLLLAAGVSEAGQKSKEAEALIKAIAQAVRGAGNEAEIAGDKFKSFYDKMEKKQTDIQKLIKLRRATGLDDSLGRELLTESEGLAASDERALKWKDRLVKEQERINDGVAKGLDGTKAQATLDAATVKYKQFIGDLQDEYTNKIKGSYQQLQKLNEENSNIGKREKKLGDKRAKDRQRAIDNYQDQVNYVSRLNALIAKGVGYEEAKIAANKDYAEFIGKTGLAQQVVQAQQIQARLDYVGALAQEEDIQNRVVALINKGASYEQAKALAQAGFTSNLDVEEALVGTITNALYEKNIQIAEAAMLQKLINDEIATGMSLEQATMVVTLNRLAMVKGSLTDFQKKTAQNLSDSEKALKIENARQKYLTTLQELERQKNVYIQAQAGGYANLIKNMAIANKMASDPDLSPDQAKKLVEAEELTNYEKELAELKRQTYIATLNESEAVKTLVGNYSTMDSVQIGALAKQQRLLEIAKELAEEAEKQHNNPLGDFSNVDFSAFGDFGNPFQSALDGMNELIRTTMSGGEQIKKLNEEIDAAKLKGLDTTQQEFDLNLEMQKQTKDKKQATDKAITSGLALTKSLFKEESKGYKVVSGMEKAYQASKIAFTLWEKKDVIAFNALKLQAYVTDTLGFTTGAYAKIVAQQALNVAQAQGAVASAAQAPPPVGFASAAAMIALMAGLGIAISGGGGSSYVDTSNQGTGTVFGDSEAKSESIKKSIDLLADSSDLMLPLTSAMLRSLRNIESSIGGVTNLILRQATGGGFNVQEGFKQNTAGKLVGGVGQIAGGVGGAVGGGIAGAFGAGLLGAGMGSALGIGLGLATGGIGLLLGASLGKLLGGLFGTKTTVKASGLFGKNQKLGDILSEGFNLQEYVDIQTKKKALGVTTSNKSSTKYSKADAELSNQFTLIFKGFYDSILSATDILGADMSVVQTNLENAVVSIGKINLKGLKGDEIQEKLEAVFGAAADSLAKQAFGSLEDFQTVGEGYYETLVKVATGVEQAAYFTDRLNVTAIKYNDIINKQGDVAAEIVRQSVLLVDTTKNIKGGFYDLVNSFDGTAEELTDFVLTLRDLQDQLFMTGKNAAYLTSSMILGAGGLDSLASGLDAYFEMLSPAEQAAELTRRLTNEFAIFGKKLPADVKAFRNLVSSIDITTEAGQKLYGQIIALAPEFNDLQDALDSANSDVNALVQSLRDLAEQARAARGETEQPRNLAYTRSQFEQASVLAMQGDTASAEKLLTLGKDLMGLSKTYSVTGSEYARDLALIQRAATVSADIQEQGLGTSISTTLTPSTGTGTTTPTIATTNSTMTTELQGMREELNAGLFAIAKFVQNVDSRTERWDDGGRMMVGIQPENGDKPVPVVVTP